MSMSAIYIYIIINIVAIKSAKKKHKGEIRERAEHKPKKNL